MIQNSNSKSNLSNADDVLSVNNRYSILSNTDSQEDILVINEGNHTGKLDYQSQNSSAKTDNNKDSLMQDNSAQINNAAAGEQVSSNGNTDKSNKQGRNSPNDVQILLMGDSIIKNIDPRKISRRKTVKICLPGKRADQITAEVKSIAVTNPSHVIIHAGTNNLPTDSVRECAKHVEDLTTCVKERFPGAKFALSAITTRRDIALHEKIIDVNKRLQELCTKHGLDL